MAEAGLQSLGHQYELFYIFIQQFDPVGIASAQVHHALPSTVVPPRTAGLSKEDT